MGLIGDIIGLLFKAIMALVTPVVKIIFVGGVVELIVMGGLFLLLLRALSR